MPGWPTENIDTTQFDEATDDASQARAELEKTANHVNDMKDSRGASDGIASLDSTGKVPQSELPIQPAALGGTGQQAYTVGDILVANATDTLTKVPAGTLGYVLKSNGPGAAPSWQQEGGGLTTGTRMIFQNSTAPTGWTKETNSSFNDTALRIVTGTVGSGGSSGFSSVFGTNKSTAGHTLTVGQMPAHTHNVQIRAAGGFTNNGAYVSGASGGNSGAASTVSNAALSQGSNQAHSHGLSLDLKYRDFILAQKD